MTELEQILNCLREANAEGMIVDTIWMDDDQTLFDFIDLCIEGAALAQRQEAEPAGYVHEFVSQFSGAPVWRHSAGEWNGQWPKSSRPYFFHPPRAAETDVRCEGCGYMTHHREHVGCVRAAQPADIDADELSNFIRKIDGNHSMGAGALAENIVEWIGKQAAQPQVPKGIAEKYNELLYHVARKFPNESRHETALRYIKNAESAEDACSAAKEEN